MNSKYEKSIARLIEANEIQKALELAKRYKTKQTWVAVHYQCDVEYDTPTAEEAAQNYVEDGDWDVQNKTEFLQIYVWPKYYVGSVSVEDKGDSTWLIEKLNPKIPSCDDGDDGDHVWSSPYDIVGGLKENPGVWGKGGGEVIHEVCLKCGCRKTTDTWAQCPDTGIQGLVSVKYEPEYYAEELMLTQ
jgi:hypothetical protein